MKKNNAPRGEPDERTLATFAMKSVQSKGRAWPEPEHSYRNPFQRDRDRVIHTSAFRRLEGKTQVFVSFKGDYYRNRLTHTIEVAQISRTIARALHLNEGLAEAIALAHDLGHSPFGHVGESVLNEIMAGEGGFEHNKQSLRIVDLLETRYPDFPGLNLSWEVREGIMKHRTTYDSPDQGSWPDAPEAPTLEAQIVNVADEITYTCHDLDDGLKSGVLKEDDLEEVRLPADLLSGMDHPALAKNEKMRRYELIRGLINTQVTDLLEQTRRLIARNNIETLADVRNASVVLVAFSPATAEKSAELKKFLYDNFYLHPRVRKISSKVHLILNSLHQAYLDDPSLIPPDNAKRDAGETPRRVACDYIAGMTDKYASDEYEKICDKTL